MQEEPPQIHVLQQHCDRKDDHMQVIENDYSKVSFNKLEANLQIVHRIFSPDEAPGDEECSNVYTESDSSEHESTKEGHRG